MTDLEALRAENIAAWRRDPVLPDFATVANTSSAKYLPALEAEVERLREHVCPPWPEALVTAQCDVERLREDLRIADEATLVLAARAAAAEAEVERLRPLAEVGQAVVDNALPADEFFSEAEQFDRVVGERNEALAEVERLNKALAGYELDASLARTFRVDL